MAIGGFNGSDPSPTLAAVPAVRRRRRDPLLHRRGGGFGRSKGGSSSQQRDRRVGGGHLHRHHGRRRHRLRPPTTRGRRRDRGPALGVGPARGGHRHHDAGGGDPGLQRGARPGARRCSGCVDHLATLPWTFRVTIADNASTDGTAVIARRLAHTYDDVRVVHLAEKGRGRALKRCGAARTPTVLVYMDVDLSTDLNALLPLVAPLISGHSDLAIGTRLGRGSRVERGPKRELISRGYNLLLRGTLPARFSDAQCGFKAIRADVAREVLPLVEDNAWFFDTELLVLAERAGLRIHEVPVDWVDDPDSRVDIVRTALDDVRGIVRVGRGLLSGRLPVSDVAERLGRASADAGGGPAGASRSRCSRSSGSRRRSRTPCSSCCCAARTSCVHRQPAGAAADGGGQHRGQPAADLRGARPAGRDAPPAARADRLRDRAGGHERVAVAAARERLAEAGGRGGRC